MAAGYIMPQSNFTATTDPTVNDDVTLGYSAGSPWVNTATGFIFALVDPSDGAADWQQIYPAALVLTTLTADTTLLKMMVAELRIMNLHLSTMSDNVFDSTDVEI